ncbi:hypothetical protein ACFU3J_17085 [Streptomyces sp. NPDC057411]|uniref:hypothetical protein n=1 Tax=unclassified Streptomyces TaxID=2593676 RepID=UPI0036418285
MNALHQYLFDSYRAAQHRTPAPPVPGTHDLAVLRTTLRRILRRPGRRAAGCGAVGD